MKNTKLHAAVGLSAILLLAVSLCVSLPSCTGGVADDGSRASENSRVTVSTDNASQSEASSDTSAAEKSEVGTRKNAAKTDDTVEYTFDSFVYGNAVLEITLKSVVRGGDAWSIISNANMFNAEPPEGKEYVIAEFSVVNVKDLSGEDQAVTVNDSQFSFSNSAFAKENQFNFVTLDGKLSAQLYEGASAAGTVVLISDIDDACYAVFNDDVWFALGE